MYFCIGSDELVFGTRRFPITDIGFEFSVTVEDGTLSIHWYKTVDKNLTFDFPWRPQLVDVQHKEVDKFFAASPFDIREVTVYEIRERFVPWFLRRVLFAHRFFGWRCSIAIGYQRDGETQFRRIKSVENWLRRNDLQRTPDARPRLQVVPTSTSESP